MTSGPYAYIANPMQVSAILLLLSLAVATRSASLAFAALSGAAFATGLAKVSEDAQLVGPRTRPASMIVPGRLWLDDDCGPCAAVRDRLAGTSLSLESASAFPGPTLWRARYEADDGHTASGVAAVARGIEHCGLLYAYPSWFLLLPGLDRLAQLVTDALIAPPHPAVEKNGVR
ncbi:hypothetical protein ACQP2E_11690 [Actinoplanes sp. CA-015351]|uniref:hypothetical protein n=1 Tax=Actinoplanes sp. CA-015351 TaxID=3239897 RepID=UPI003D97EB31